MSNVHKLKDKAVIDDEAAQWVWRLDDENVSPATVAAYRQWLKADPRHEKAIKDFAEIWGRLDALAVLKHDDKLKTVRRGVDEDELQRRVPIPLRWARYGAVAVSLCAAVLATLIFVGPRDASLDARDAVQSYATAVGQQRTIELADGSIVEINTNTIVDVDYSKRNRLVRLRKGEAHFEVAKNPQRPFIVEAGDKTVRAVGTVFNIYVAPDAPAEVLVTEGKVAVAKRAAATEPAKAAEILLVAGESLKAERLDPQAVAVVTKKEIERALAWRKGMLVFEGEPLEKVVAELSRYTEVRFVIVDDAIRARPVGGYFRTDDVDSILSVLEQGLSISVERRDDRVILLSGSHEG